MYGERLVETLLMSFDLLEIMEMNDLSEDDVLQILVDGGYIVEPERIVSEFESFETEEEYNPEIDD